MEAARVPSLGEAVESRNEALAAKKALNLLLLREDFAASRNALRALPPIISLHTSELCNLKCTMCQRSVVPGRRKLERSILQDVFDQLMPTALKAFANAFLGEPLLGDFDLVTDNARRYGVKIDLVTNGTLLTLQRYREIRETLNRVNVSVDAHVPTIYERIRAGGRFDILRKNLEEIAAERRRAPDGVVFDISAVVLKSNLGILPSFVDFGAALGVDHVTFQPLRHFGKATVAEDVTGSPSRVGLDRAGGRPAIDFSGSSDADSLYRVYGNVLEAGRRTGTNICFGDFGLPDLIMRPVPSKLEPLEESAPACWNVAMNFALFPTGDVYPCCHPTTHIMGNVFDSPAADIWNSPAAQRLRAAHFARRRIAYCSGCIQAPYLLPARDSRVARGWSRARLAVNHVRNKMTSWRYKKERAAKRAAPAASPHGHETSNRRPS